jgi:hypothetical protein
MLCGRIRGFGLPERRIMIGVTSNSPPLLFLPFRHSEKVGTANLIILVLIVTI